MKARLLPVYFESARHEEYDEQYKTIKELLKDEADLLEPVPLGAPVNDVDAVVFLQLVGEAYRQVKDIQNINVPIVIITSEFGTVAMWTGK
jgi:hypothetical protein